MRTKQKQKREERESPEEGEARTDGEQQDERRGGGENAPSIRTTTLKLVCALLVDPPPPSSPPFPSFFLKPLFPLRLPPPTCGHAKGRGRGPCARSRWRRSRLSYANVRPQSAQVRSSMVAVVRAVQPGARRACNPGKSNWFDRCAPCGLGRAVGQDTTVSGAGRKGRTHREERFVDDQEERSPCPV